MPFPAQGPQGSSNPGTDPSVTPYTSATQAVTSTATSITTVPASTAPVLVVNGSTQIFLGSSNAVTASATSGYPLAANAAVLLAYGWGSLVNEDETGGVSCSLYGITASGSSTVTFYTVTNFPGNE